MTEPVKDQSPASAAPSAPRHRSHKILTVLSILILIPIVVFALWAWATLGYSYSRGDRAGYVQKLSKKGWLCKTWEGELAMANLPGTMPEIFHFTVRNDSLAALIDKNLGRRVSLSYEQHRGVPTTCFGETEYFVTDVKQVQP